MEPSSYAAAHNLVRKTRGKAVEHQCVLCGNQAREWALRRELVDDGVEWSPNPDDYYPLCRSCHVYHDIPENRRKEIAAMRGQRGGTARAEHAQSDPEWAAKLAETMLQVQQAGGQATAERLRVDPEFAAAHARRMSDAVTARHQRDRADDETWSQRQEERSGAGKLGGAATGRIKRMCADCGLVTTPGPMGKHLNVSGHSGYTDVEL